MSKALFLPPCSFRSGALFRSSSRCVAQATLKPAIMPSRGQVRVRQHLNPLARRWQEPLKLEEDWYLNAFEDHTLGTIVDVGTAKGRFLLELASKDSTHNYLGIEIRRPLVEEANRVAKERGLKNLWYVAGNANVDLDMVLNGVKGKGVERVLIQFCDPWFKKRHHKRRMVNEQLVNMVWNGLMDGGAVFVQSDVIQVAEQMRDLFDAHDGFERHHDGWLTNNPLQVETEREKCVISKGGDVYRCWYDRVGGGHV